ncbi:hypothetical protein Y032_0081g1416 [Ancylostoma ceylanicum]|nr:hypothetical protein Y032_0081g1416 [Ancylostoma ceylanicum]
MRFLMSFTAIASSLVLFYWYELRRKEERFVSLAIFHPRLGNQMIRFASGYGIARRLKRTLYVPLYNDMKSKIVQQFWLRIANAFPKTAENFRFFPGTVNATVVPLAVFDGKQAGFTYEDPIRYVNHSSEYLSLSLGFGRNVQYIMDYLPAIREMFAFSNEIVDQGQKLVRELGLSYASAMCVHTRRTDFATYSITSEFNETIDAAAVLARRTHLKQFFIFGDDLSFMRRVAQQLQDREKRDARVSTFSEFEDFYLSSQICGSFLISAAASTFGWWLAFFSTNQSSVYYIGRQFTNGEDVPEAELYLPTWKRLVI